MRALVTSRTDHWQFFRMELAGGNPFARIFHFCLVSVCLWLMPVSACAQALLDVPSGQRVSFIDKILASQGSMGEVLRFRFLAPQIAREGGDIDFARAELDMLFLCENYALPLASEGDETPVQIVISLSDRLVEFGTSDPSATQYFEAYRPDGGKCEWEGL